MLRHLLQTANEDKLFQVQLLNLGDALHVDHLVTYLPVEQE